MTYTGTLLKELHTIVEICLQRNACICAIGGQRFPDSMVGNYFPDPGPGGKSVRTINARPAEDLAGVYRPRPAGFALPVDPQSRSTSIYLPQLSSPARR